MEIQTLQSLGHVGFSSLPDQLYQKCLRNGLSFNLLCVGETGIGKTTLMESLFNLKFNFKPCKNDLKTVELNTQNFDVEEGNVCLKLSITETAGFGDQLTKDSSTKVICDFIDTQFESYLQEEMKFIRCLQLYKDTRIHVCLYFISPTGHGLKSLDIAAFKKLCERVNVIPIIAKSDTISKDELKRFKQKILAELKENGIEYYKFPEDDETLKQENIPLNNAVPFAVIGSTDFVKVGNKDVRARQYPWGIVEVENENHCDFVKLRAALLRVNVEDLRERTHMELYEFYRRRKLAEIGLKDSDKGTELCHFYDKAQNRMSSIPSEKMFSADFLERLGKKQKEISQRQAKIQEKENSIVINYKTQKGELYVEEMQLQQEMDDFVRLKTLFLEEKTKKRK